jgi:site-specific recombinase XerD
MAQYPSTKGLRFPAETLSVDECRDLLRACSRRAPSGIRNAALITLLWRGGLRLAEALALRPKDVDRKAGTVRVLQGKGKKARTVGLDPEAMALVERWMDKRKALGIDGRKALFCTITDGGAGVHETKAGTPLSQAYVRQVLKRLADKAGVERRVHAHGLRHSFAFQLANEGAPVHLIQQALGHSNLSTTNTYLSHLGAKDVIDLMRARAWSS